MKLATNYYFYDAKRLDIESCPYCKKGFTTFKTKFTKDDIIACIFCKKKFKLKIK